MYFEFTVRQINPCTTKGLLGNFGIKVGANISRLYKANALSCPAKKCFKREYHVEHENFHKTQSVANNLTAIPPPELK